MSIEQEQQLRRPSSIHRSSPIRSPAAAGCDQQKHHGCLRGISVFFSIMSKRQQSPRPAISHQVSGSNCRVRKDSENKNQEDGFLKRMSSSNAETSSVLELDSTTRSIPITRMPIDPYLEDIREQAMLNGWSIEPHEVEFHETVGRGTTADIYTGTWRGLDVAIKWIYPEFFRSNESGQAWFAQELDTLSRQSHPFVLQLLGACLLPPENGWIVTELLSGKTVRQWLHGNKGRQRERSVPLPPLTERLDKGQEIAQAMQYLHEQTPMIIHRDLKLSNILLDAYMHIRVADFGNARFLADGEQAGTGELGTYVYMAPEVISSEPYDEKCDVYSFGIILNELITGEHPYIETSFSPSEIAFQVVNGKLRPKLPEDEDGQYKELIDLICCSWSADASARPSFAEITSAFRDIQLC